MRKLARERVSARVRHPRHRLEVTRLLSTVARKHTKDDRFRWWPYFDTKDGKLAWERYERL